MLTQSGAQFVMMVGVKKTPRLFVDNLDMNKLVIIRFKISTLLDINL